MNVRRLNTVFFLTFIAVSFISLFAIVKLRGHEKQATGASGMSQSFLNIFSEQELFSYLAETNIVVPQTSMVELRRNSQGTCILVDINNIYEKKIIVVPLNKDTATKEIIKPASITFLDSECNIVAWSDNISKEIHFASGVTLPLNMSSRVGFDPSSTYFFIAQGDKTEIARVNAPSNILLKTNMFASHIFVCASRIYILGHCSDKTDFNAPIIYQAYLIEEDSVR